MKMRRPFILVGVLALLFGQASRASGIVIDRILAVVDQEVITQSALDKRLLEERPKLPDGAKDSLSPFPMPSNSRLVQRIIDTTLIAQTAQRMGITVTDRELDQALDDIQRNNGFPDREELRKAIEATSLTWDRYRADIRTEMTFLKVIQGVIASDLVAPEGEVEVYYRRHPEKFYQSDKIALDEIVLPLAQDASEEAAEEVGALAATVTALLLDGQQWEQVAMNYKEARKNNLGRFKKGELIPGLEQIVFEMGVGDISAPVRAQDGFHLFIVTEKEPAGAQSLEEARPSIIPLVLHEKREELTRQGLSNIKKSAFIEIK